jgi:hypothetical protein
MEMAEILAEIRWGAPATLHERVWGGPGTAMVGGPIAYGTLGDMLERALRASEDRLCNLSISVDGYATGGSTWLEIEDIKALAGRCR